MSPHEMPKEDFPSITSAGPVSIPAALRRYGNLNKISESQNEIMQGSQNEQPKSIISLVRNNIRGFSRVADTGIDEQAEIENKPGRFTNENFISQNDDPERNTISFPFEVNPNDFRFELNY